VNNSEFSPQKYEQMEILKIHHQIEKSSTYKEIITMGLALVGTCP
jgi:hypothetical protein